MQDEIEQNETGETGGYSEYYTVMYCEGDYSDTNNLNQAGRYIYNKTELQLFCVTKDLYEYENQADCPYTTASYRSEALSIVGDIKDTCDNYIVLVCYRGKSYWGINDYEVVIFSDEAEDVLGDEGVAILSDVMTNPHMVDKNCYGTDIYKPVKEVLPQILDGMTYEEFLVEYDEYYTAYTGDKSTESHSTSEVVSDVFVAVIGMGIILMPIVLIIGIAVTILKLVNSHRKKLDAETADIKAEAELKEALATKEILEADIEEIPDYVDKLAEKYTSDSKSDEISKTGSC